MRGAIFDMDGLLIDSERIWQATWHELARERGIVLPDSFAAEMCGLGGAAAAELIRRRYGTDDPRPIQMECAARVHRKEENGVPLKAGVRTILEGMRAEGYRIAIASSSPAEMIHRNLKPHGIDSLFDVFTSGKEVPRGKPDPDIYLLAAERLGLPPEECYAFEDSCKGIESGWRAGCRTIMIPDLVQPDERTREMCSCVFASLGEAWESLKRF